VTLDVQVDEQYNLRGHPDREPAYADLKRRGDTFKAQLEKEGRANLDIRYGCHPRAQLDVFSPVHSRGILVFFHGGYWRALDKSLFSVVADPFVNNGLTVVMPAYPLAPESSIHTIVEHAQLSLDWVKQTYSDDLPVIVSGHSAGAHLAAMTALNPSLVDQIVGSILVSGLFDLKPLRVTNVNVEAQLDAQAAAELSPALLPHGAAHNALLIVGGDETTGFKFQTNAYAEVLKRTRANVKSLEPDGLNHFTILAPLADSTTQLHQQVQGFIDDCISRRASGRD
jgi:arylformamidase